MTANLADLVTEAASAAPEAVALVEARSGRQLTWAGLEDAVERVAAGFGGLGLVAGNRVLLITAQRLELVVGYFAALRAGLVAAPVNPRSAAGELVRAVTDSRARVLLADDATLPVLRPLVAGLRGADLRSGTVGGGAAGSTGTVGGGAAGSTGTAGGGATRSTGTATGGGAAVPRIVTVGAAAERGEVPWTTLAGAVPAPGLRRAADPERLAVLLQTSGTSGTPRAAMLTHRALLANLDQVAALRPPLAGPDDVVYGVLPLHHVFGLNAVLGQAVRARARLLLAGGFDAEGSLDDIREHGVTVAPVTPTVLAHWTRVPRIGDRLSSVRAVVCGSAPVSPQLADSFRSLTGLVVHQGYGLTEAAPVVTSTWGRPPKPGSVGRPLPGVTVRLSDETGKHPEPGDPGEILVAGANLFSGYWPTGEEGPVGGWLATGDLGILDEDGDLFLADRLTDLVIVSGFNVFPIEVEEVIARVDGVLETAVVGVPDDVTGQALVAYVRIRGAEPEEAGRVVDRVRDACAQQLAGYKRPRRIEVVDQLPHTAVGGVSRGRLRSAARRERWGLVE